MAITLPLTPLYRFAEQGSDNEHYSQTDFADSVGVTKRAVSRWKAADALPWYSADKAAVALGVHPMFVWGNEWLTAFGDFDTIEAEVIAELENDVISDLEAEVA